MPYYLKRCIGKRRHETRDEAKAVRARMVAQGRVKAVDRLRAYRCPNCGGWHLGKARR